jgi:hypothetical protein
LIGDFGDCCSNAAIDFLGGPEEGQLRRNSADLAPLAGGYDALPGRVDVASGAGRIAPKVKTIKLSPDTCGFYAVQSEAL